MEKVIIGVCTAKRPQMLRACLQSLASNSPPHNTIVELVVCDNEVGQNNRNGVLEFSRSCPFPVHYVHEPRRGIPQARNAVVAKALEVKASWLAFIDDDETAEPNWIAQLYNGAKAYAADAIGGPIIRDYPQKMPFWGVKRDPPPYAPIQEGEVVDMLPTYNAIASMRLFRHPPDGMGLSFDESLAFSGGEDTRLGEQAVARGARMIWTNKAVVHEIVCYSRLTFAHNLRLAYHCGLYQFVLFESMPDVERVTARIVFRALRGAASGVVWVLLLPMLAIVSPPTFKQRALTSGRQFAYVAGTLLGLTGIKSQYYRKVDGF
jgi:succinoglycan biosynthesis protein ExoM